MRLVEPVGPVLCLTRPRLRHRTAPVRSRRLTAASHAQTLSRARAENPAASVQSPFWECPPGTWYCPPPNGSNA